MASFENSLVMSVDFVVPRAKAGRKHLANLVAACRPCNLIKGHHVFKNLDEAKAFVLKRRAELHTDWEGRMGKVRAKSATA
jgi:5-methylcytosine-specific restriction endonuclease McrA